MVVKSLYFHLRGVPSPKIEFLSVLRQLSSGMKSGSENTKVFKNLVQKFEYTVIFFILLSNHEFWSQNKFLKISGWNILFLFENIFFWFLWWPNSRNPDSGDWKIAGKLPKIEGSHVKITGSDALPLIPY